MGIASDPDDLVEPQLVGDGGADPFGCGVAELELGELGGGLCA